MKRKFTGIIASSQLPLLEYVYCVEAGEAVWRLWLNYNRSKTAGTYLEMYSDGLIMKQTALPTGEIVNVSTIKPAEFST